MPRGRRFVGVINPKNGWRLAHLGVFGLVTEVAFANLGTADGAPDEFTYRTCGEAYVHGAFACNLEHPLLAKEILGIGSLVFGDGIAAARATTALVAIATAIFCYLFCRDVAGRGAGLLAAGMWGLLPQVGLENGTTLEAVRIDRFALLDPYVAAFFAMALFAGARLARRGGRGVAFALGAAVAAAACAKAPGALIAPFGVGLPLAYRRARGAPIARDGAWVAGGALAVAVASYAPLGPSAALRAIRFMVTFQLHHGARAGIVAGRYTVHAPWWSDLWFAFHSLGAPIAIALGALALIGLVAERGGAAYALATSGSIIVGVGVGLHLSAPYYFVDWEPGVVIAGAIGLSALLERREVVARVLGMAVALLVLVGAARTVVSATTLQHGPYAEAAAAMQCQTTCLVAYVGFLDVFANYLPPTEYLTAVPPSTRAGRVVARVRSEGHTLFVRPDVVALDPAAFVLHGSWRRSIEYFEGHAAQLGYTRVRVASRIEIFRRTSSAARFAQLHS